LRTCVHCGFCTATCPTYQTLHDERDGPRGRIYLIRQLLEGGEVTERTRTHLDRCLSCRSCETTCPSGVKYGRLLDIGRGLLDEALPRLPQTRLLHWGLRQVLPWPRRFTPLLRLGQAVRPLLPASLRQKLPPRQPASPWPRQRQARVMLALAGCVQAGAAPNTNAAAARVLDRLGITLVEAPGTGCCGAVSYHLGAHAEGLDFMRRNIDAWWPALEAGAETLVMTASGCGAMVKEYGQLLRDDPAYADKARRVSELCRDVSEVLLAEDLRRLPLQPLTGRTAVHCPCTLQHALKLNGVLEQVLERVGVELAHTTEKHLCCGSAGTYSLLQPRLSRTLQARKLRALSVDAPVRIVTANIGCQLHLGSQADVPVMHWIELLDAACRQQPSTTGQPS
ncbi:MAG: glycolate oxidase subunit GlcF, partial [Thiothrix sp.]|nr:glycolate oxidase subunit GlcF [Thiothrix sp.]